MGKGRDRGPRRRGFDDDFYAPPPAREERPRRSFQRAPRETPAPSGPAIDAIVKWFAPDKGFGFVELADGSGDAFLHVAVLQAAGHEAVEPETKLSVQVGQGQKGSSISISRRKLLPMATRNPGNRNSGARTGHAPPATGTPMHSAARGTWTTSKTTLFPLQPSSQRDRGLQIAVATQADNYARAAERGSRAALLFGPSSNIANRTLSACAASMRPAKGAPRKPRSLQNG